MRWHDPEELRFTDAEIIALVRRARFEVFTDDEILVLVRRVESHIRQVVHEELSLHSKPVEQVAKVMSHELSKLTSEVERGLASMSVAIMRKR